MPESVTGRIQWHTAVLLLLVVECSRREVFKLLAQKTVPSVSRGYSCPRTLHSMTALSQEPLEEMLSLLIQAVMLYSIDMQGRVLWGDGCGSAAAVCVCGFGGGGAAVAAFRLSVTPPQAVHSRPCRHGPHPTCQWRSPFPATSCSVC